MIYDTNIDLVNDNVYTKFGLNRSICFQDTCIELKLNSDDDPRGVANLDPQGQDWQDLSIVPLNIATD